LFARDFNFKADQVLRYILPETTRKDWLSEGYHTKFGHLRDELQRAMFGSPGMIRIVSVPFALASHNFN
jgi:hypothetical protein